MPSHSLIWCPVFLLVVGSISCLSLLSGISSKESFTSQVSGIFWRVACFNSSFWSSGLQTLFLLYTDLNGLWENVVRWLVNYIGWTDVDGKWHLLSCQSRVLHKLSRKKKKEQSSPKVCIVGEKSRRVYIKFIKGWAFITKMKFKWMASIFFSVLRFMVLRYFKN